MEVEQVFVSSVYIGLEEYRRVVCSAIDNLGGMRSICMERFGARRDPPLEVCLRAIREAAYFIGILGCNYGSSPLNDDRSYSEIEYDYSRSVGKPALMFAAPENISMPVNIVESEAQRRLQESFRAKVGADYTLGKFGSPLDLGTQVVIGLNNLKSERQREKMEALEGTLRATALEFSASINIPTIPMTTLLFPFVTNQAGFDTGIAVSNTSASPFGKSPHAGACTIHYYGNVSGGAPAPTSQTSPTVAPGGQLVYLLSSGGGGVISTPGFQGYIVVECGFPDARGFAFVRALGSREGGSAYLAEVIPNRSVSSK